MKKKKRNNEEDDIIEKILEEELPFEGQEKEPTYNYRCQECGYEEEVPAFIVDEMAYLSKIDGIDSSEMPVLECPYCPGGMVYKGKKE
ncbi:hypothetical protein ciss_06240 [Carboxydothermus islandicus]|uniref:Uncharacterized protein n=2 Tax=Carboxydothermus islandicus TaxID=661089 RepID=A0A1L8D0Q8_9THEO|nr:hypothetical protein [Carboxydothermus islandicus]GAV24691.1 hypothetical protein ciss_06240 [Carboxydothermus islandicus]